MTTEEKLAAAMDLLDSYHGLACNVDGGGQVGQYEDWKETFNRLQSKWHVLIGLDGNKLNKDEVSRDPYTLEEMIEFLGKASVECLPNDTVIPTSIPYAIMNVLTSLEARFPLEHKASDDPRKQVLAWHPTHLQYYQGAISKGGRVVTSGATAPFYPEFWIDVPAAFTK